MADPRGESFEEVAAIVAGKRCGVQWSTWMGDWFTSWSPRNDNSNAEGCWGHWVNLALGILSDPLTQIVRPDVFMEQTPTYEDFYGPARTLTDEELLARFPLDEDRSRDAFVMPS